MRGEGGFHALMTSSAVSERIAESVVNSFSNHDVKLVAEEIK